MFSTSVRRLLAAVAAVLGGAGFLVTTAGPAGAHGVEGGSLPAPPWLLGYAGAFVVLIAAVAVRSAWPAARLGASAVVSDPPPRTPFVARPHLGHWAGSVLFALVLAAAWIGPDSPAANVAPVAVLIVWWVVLPVACLLLGDVMARISPFQLPVAALERPHRGDRAPAPPWTAAAFLGAFAWFLLAYHRPGSPRALAVFLVVYAACAIVGGMRWGRSWVATGEGFGGLSAAVALLSWRRRDRRAVPGLVPLMVVWLGSTAFDGVSSTPFWIDVLGTSRGWSRTMLNTVGLVWLIAIVAGIYLLAFRLLEHPDRPTTTDAGGTDDDVGVAPNRSLLAPVGLALVPLALAWLVAHDITLLLAEGQNFIVLLSDPLGEGWDLFGTIHNTIDYGIVQSRGVRWVQLAALLAGHVAAVVLAHDVALRRRRRRAAMAVTWTVAAMSAISVVASALLVLG